MVFTIYNGEEKLYHRKDCACCKGVAAEDMRTFDKPFDAEQEGYLACNLCSPLGRLYQADKERIEQYARHNHLKLKLQNNVLCIDTGEAYWMVTVSRKTNQLELQHESTQHLAGQWDAGGNLNVRYHEQEDARFNNLYSYIMYVCKHDHFRRMERDAYRRLPQDSVSQRKAYRRERARAERVRCLRVSNLIEKLELERKAAGE